MDMTSLNQSSVDILCLCFNGEKYLDQLFNCLLSQTYNNITIIIADDGSTDNSYLIMNHYRKKIEERGYNYIVLHQENGGPASAYNLCLSKVSGDYILQIDCDDLLTDDAIETFVNALDNNDIGFVRSNGWMHYIDEDKEDVEFIKIDSFPLNVQNNNNICIPILTGSAYLAPPSHFMYRRECLKEIYNDLIIDDSRLGQGYQIILPLSYKFKTMFIDKPLFWYTVRKDSLEHSKISKEKELWRIEESARLIRVCLKAVEAPDSFIDKYANLRESKLKLDFAYKYKDKKMSKNAYSELKRIERPGWIDKKNYYSTQFRVLDILRILIRKIHLVFKK